MTPQFNKILSLTGGALLLCRAALDLYSTLNARFAAKKENSMSTPSTPASTTSTSTGFFSKIAAGFSWLGKEIVKVAEWAPKVIILTDDIKDDAAELLPMAVAVFEDVDQLAIAAIKDSAAAIVDAEALVAAIVAAAKDDALNIAEDETVVAAFNTFVTQVTTKSDWLDLLTAVKKLTSDWDAFGANAKAAIAKLEADAGSQTLAASTVAGTTAS